RCRNCLRGSFILNPPSPTFSLNLVGAAGSWRICVLAARQAHRKYRTFARLARYGDVAAHHARELAREGKAESRAPETLCSRGIGLGELLKQLCLLLRRHADAGVGHGKLDPVASVCHPVRPQRDIALLGELKGIAQEVEQYLPQPHGVDGEGAEVV